MSIVDDYIDFDNKYKKIYGNETVVLMEVGDFFELYGVQNDFETCGANLQEISDILNIRVTSKNKSIIRIDRKNPLMSGFPSYIVEKHIQTLIENQYTVILVEQFENEQTKTGKLSRKVTKIITPSTYFNSQSNSINCSNYLMVCYWDILKQNSQNCLSLGCSLVDISTGTTQFYECVDKNSSSTLCLEEAYRIIQMYNPSEIVHISFDNVNKQEQKKIIEHLHSNTNIKVLEKWSIDTIYKKIRYQEECIKKSYKNQMSFISPIDCLKLEMKPLAIISFCYMLQYVYEHDEKLASNLLVPDEIQRNKHMSIEYNSIQQLNIKNQNNGEKCLSKILNRCITTFGKRMFWNWLINPIIDINDLNERYESVEYFLNKNLYLNVRKYLKLVSDIQKFLRKISIEKVVPNDWPSLVSSFTNINCILELIRKNTGSGQNKISKHLDIENNHLFCNDFLDFLNQNLNIDECSKYQNLNEVKTNIFQEEIYNEIDIVSNFILDDFKFLNNLCSIVNKTLGEEKTSACKLEFNDKLGYSFTITKKRWETFLEKIKLNKKQEKTKYDLSIDLTKFEYKRSSVKRKVSDNNNSATEDIETNDFDFSTIIAKPTSSSSSNVRLTSNKIENISNSIILNQQKLQKLINEKHSIFLKELFEKYETQFLSLVKCISEIDVYCTNAINAFEFSYNKPQLFASDSSFLIANDIRHPIVERIQTQSRYIENDVHIGMIPEILNSEVSENSNGILLYGVNSSGKSTLMKSIGLNVIMAQAGMFVPCSSLRYSPYKHIFTRISGNDNIYRGMSSFTVEMTELKNILDRCNQNSLILGDELCSGTESVSALAIVASGILDILSKNGNFIFATHLHELCDLEVIKEKNVMDRLQVYHIHVDCDESGNGNIIFNRKLKKGRGNSLYGLEICKFLKLPDHFLKNAEKIRKQLMNISTNIVEPKQSKYNSKIVVSSCGICGYTPPPNSLPLETHHIVYQHTQNEDGFVKLNNTSFHKNEEYNLIPLCQKCHDDEHNDIIKIKGYVETTSGRKILYDKCDNQNKNENNLKKHISYEDGKWKFRKSPRSKWRDAEEIEIEKFLKDNNFNLQSIDTFKI